MSPEKAKKIEKLEADVVIIGGGGAGMPAALTALDNGAKSVIVVEKRFNTGGDALRANWIFAVESRVQKEAGVTVSRDDIFKRALEFHRLDRVNPRMLRTFINRSADTISWLEEKGVEFELRQDTAHWTKGSPYPDSLCTFSKVYKLLKKQCQERGVRFLLRTSGKKIRRGTDGSVTGVLAQSRDGQEFDIKTRSVILCTGSFNGNKELLKKYFPYYYDENVYVTDALLTNKGDGLQLAAEAGAAMEDFCTLIRHTYSFDTFVNNRCHEAGQPTALRVNKKGQRYNDESVRDASGNALIKQGKTGYILYDDKIVQSIVDKKTPPQHPRIPLPPGKVPDFRHYLQAQAKDGVWTKISDNWDEIAQWMEADPKVLKATVDEYNSSCDRGYDEAFAKDKQYLVPLRTPPYYAIRVQLLMIETIGPVRVNERMEVLDKQDKPIPGFYAAGVIANGWESYDYGGTPPGTALGFSMAGGRIAAENAIKFALGK